MGEELLQILRRLDRIEANLDGSRTPGPWLTIEESAQYLRIGLTKMRELVNLGRIRTTNIDPESPRRSIRVHRKSLDRYLLFGDKHRLNKYERELLDELQSV